MPRRRKSRKAKKQGRIRLTLTSIIICLILLWGFTAYGEYKGILFWSSHEKIEVSIPKGTSTVDITKKLVKKGIIYHPGVFLAKLKMDGAVSKLKYGTYELEKGISYDELISILCVQGEQKEGSKFTIPEGFSTWQIANRLEQEGVCDADEFLQAANKKYRYWFLDDVPTDGSIDYLTQGFLFPDTYTVEPGSDAEDIVIMMLDQFNDVYTESMRNQTKELGYTAFDVVNMAALIEKETDIEEERHLIAGVINNRLAKNMKLQMCCSVLYALTEGRYDVTKVTYNDLKYDSPYNTYENAGLPVAPIANPGIDCIKAVLDPTKSDYLYYHTNEKTKDGSHIFTKTYEEHMETQK